MAVSVTFYKFAKRRNSTAVPSGGTALSCLLKEDTSLLAPSFIVHVESAPAWNYCSFLGRYYFITDIVSIRNNQWMISARVDVLASYKTEIGQTTAFILYDQVYNPVVVDGRLPILAPKSIESVSSPVSDYDSPSPGCYVITCIGCATADGTQGASSYAVTEAQLRSLLSAAQTYITTLGAGQTDVWEVITTFGRQVVGMGNIPENIRGVVWVPWNMAAMGDTTPQKIYFGLFDTGVVADRLDKIIHVENTTISIPWQANDWRRTAPYHQLYLYLPFVGMVQLSPENLIAETQIGVTLSINRMNGELAYMLTAGEQIIGTYSGSSGIQVPAGYSGPGSVPAAAVGAITSGAMMIAGAAAGVNPAAAAAAAGGTAAAGIKAVTPNSITLGGISGGAAAGLSMYLVCYSVFHDVSAEPNSVSDTIGTPTMAQKVIGNLSGFIQCAEASVRAAATQQELDEINAYLNGGFFYE